MTTRRTRRTTAPKTETTLAPELTIDEILEIAKEREAEPPVVEVVEIVEEKPLPKAVEFVAIPPAPFVPASVPEKSVVAPPVRKPRMMPRVKRGVRGSDKRG